MLFFTTGKLIWKSNFILEKDGHCCCSLRVEIAIVPHNLAASFIMSTVTSAVLGKTSCLEKQKEKLPTLSLPHPLPSLLCEKMAAYILPIALYVKIERSCCMPICAYCRISLSSSGWGAYFKHIPGRWPHWPWDCLQKCWPEGSLYKAMIHFYTHIRWKGFFFFNQLQSCQQLLAAEEELVSIWLHPGSHKQLVDRGHHPKRVHSWWVLPCMPSAGSVTWIQGEDLRQGCVALTRNNQRRLYCVWQGKMPNRWEMKISRNFEPSFAAFAGCCYVCFLMHQLLFSGLRCAKSELTASNWVQTPQIIREYFP